MWSKVKFHWALSVAVTTSLTVTTTTVTTLLSISTLPCSLTPHLAINLSVCCPTMSKKEPTRAQLSSRLTYQSRTPAFLLRMQNGMGGGGRDNDEDDEFEYDGSGRPPIPKRPAIPERPDDEPGSADEDDLDEKPQIVVLKEGKHLSEREVENEKRRGA